MATPLPISNKYPRLAQRIKDSRTSAFPIGRLGTRSARFATFLAILLFLFLVLPLSSPAQQPVTRRQAVAMADDYATFRWKPSARNAFHGLDAGGIRVDTPDSACSNSGSHSGWWIPNHTNTGMPYMWGGFCSIKEFKNGLKNGMYAGDIYTAEKRRLLDNAVSKYAIGIDCSGLVSRCWRLERSYSTRELPSLCIPLESYEDLKPGDILNSHNNHVLLFKQFADKDHKRLIAYEAGSPPTWKVQLDSISIPLLKAYGYKPFRYRNILD